MEFQQKQKEMEMEVRLKELELNAQSGNSSPQAVKVVKLHVWMSIRAHLKWFYDDGMIKMNVSTLSLKVATRGGRESDNAR